MAGIVQFDKVDILFPGIDDRAARGRVEAALKGLDAGKSRNDLIASNGVVVGAADVNLEIEQGEIFVLMGLSGSGKTTVLRAVNGLNKISRGRILIRQGDRVVDMSRPEAGVLKRLRNEAVSMVFQQFALLPWRTVRRNVELGLELRRMPAAEMRKIVDEWLDVVGLLPWAEKYAEELSGGMQQRVGLARALVTNPDILLMDEPFSALDPLIRNKLQDELLSLQRTVRKTIIFVTHDLDEALKIGNRIAIMKDGRVIQVGKPEDIVLRPATDYVAEFVKHMNPLTALRAASLMKPVGEVVGADGAHRFIDRDLYEIELDADGRLAGLHCRGESVGWCDADSEFVRTAGNVVLVEAGCLLKDVVEIRQMTGRPIFVCDGGRIIGFCGSNEILDALTHAGRSAYGDGARSGSDMSKPMLANSTL
ncbi:ATP-binding cassette domain-containing protein [Acidiphilium sp. AL]|uniref:ATP-binding cassette domain-containing protein n=1 Tax=Acidiphilium iwatense TaxID=768198 RepID=A0ABS9E3Z2_9PROT|nr:MULTISPECIES: ATP-binding cassette domain-containing protein [Acidiphilium]MCF3948372.1 ATP-binding cassette domain-containing protein [Acidiphilium iwatense]MCU4161852.1 ATP-binding cassette domain-containing protein [Acidiphilium sp. AL]